MLENVDFTKEAPSKEEYRAKRDELMERLVTLQQRARAEGVGLVVLFEGWNGAGKGSRISDLMYRLDARATSVHVMEDIDVKADLAFAGRPQGVTSFYPRMQRFWNALGERGTITFYDRGWYASSVQHILVDEVSVGEDEPRKGKKHKDEDDQARIARRLKAFEAAQHQRDERRISALDRAVESVAEFERQLANDGYVLVKFFVHVRQEAQRKRLKRLRDDPATRWRVSDEKLASVAEYPHAYRFYDRLLARSDFSFAPWTLVNGEDKRGANLLIAETLCKALEKALDAPVDEAAAAAAAAAQSNSDASRDEVLANAASAGSKPNKADSPDAKAEEPADGCAEPSAPELDYVPTPDPADDAEAMAEARKIAARQHAQAPTASRFLSSAFSPTLAGGESYPIEQDEYRRQLKAEQKRLGRLELEMYQKRIPLMLVFEGLDAAGKGSAIKRVAQALDARAYTIYPSPAPTRPELLHPHLWRYWTRLPKAGHVGIYDRSWYGRVLVERLEGFATPAEWGRAYDEINEFERELTRWGAILLKFWIEVDAEEQLRRFREREAEPAKRWKITAEDWRNRAKRPQYDAAVEDMLRLTSTAFAPWTVVPGNDKRTARIEVVRAVADALEARLHAPEDNGHHE